ncbi:zinc finger dihydrouridine synthase [Rhizoctonia solani AG-1 IA]|uniref:tRNA-dihydrouridine(47) synthase [NAD(P)(+)] n=1 Tax=Thanatephorus cucumeris (strain AG1-IA) TaxID=983506 RepID=L8WUR3_THACA|nr:zinc finger dihydrouridine synthase [Rhizoctonia solani AG-1 IA]
MEVAIEPSKGARQWPAGMAPIKSEYLTGDPFTTQREVPDDDAAEGKTSNLPKKRAAEESTGTDHNVEPILVQSNQTPGEGEEPDARDGEPAAKKQRMPVSERRQLAKEKRKEQKGSNKARKFARVQDEVALCHGASRGEGCIDGEGCRFSHDIARYLSTKPTDLAFPSKDLLTSQPFVSLPENQALSESHPSINKASACPNFACSGKCQSGFKCRYLGSHVELQESETSNIFKLIKDEEKYEKMKSNSLEFNFPSSGLQKVLRTHKYPFPISDAYVAELSLLMNENKSGQVIEPPLEPHQKTEGVDPEAQNDTPDVPLRASEKKRLRWQGMSCMGAFGLIPYLSPFRRLCAGFGAQITCSEMALSQSLLQGANSEWSLVRRHPSEKIFGVQIAGSKIPQLVRAAELLANEFGPKSGRERAQIDFVDVNCGCPIDMVFKSGAGSVPLTIKVRTGIKDGRNTSHKLMPRLARWGVNAFTVGIHGRTRQQRYTKFADWDYIKECVETLRTSTEDEDRKYRNCGGAFEQYWANVEQTGVDGIMVGRGALIKPWIFSGLVTSAIRETHESSSHWGSDTVGVNNTRRFLCEALSFTYRYIPIGLLERLPGKINERPPAYRGRDELGEWCQVAPSNKSSDWVRISEMFLGPAPEGWTFTPKHKSNAQGSEEGNG